MAATSWLCSARSPYAHKKVQLSRATLETAETAKEHLQPVGTPLLGENPCSANNSSGITNSMAFIDLRTLPP